MRRKKECLNPVLVKDLVQPGISMTAAAVHDQNAVPMITQIFSRDSNVRNKHMFDVPNKQILYNVSFLTCSE